MTTKIHINYSQGLLEVEGSEEFASMIFKDFREMMVDKSPQVSRSVNTAANITEDDNTSEIQNRGTTRQRSKSKKSGTSSKDSLSVVNDFYSGDMGVEFIKNIKKYDLPKPHERLVTYFVYIMQKIGLINISANHILTAYRLAGIKTPDSLRSVINNAKNRSGWLVINDEGYIKTHHNGDQMIEIPD